MMSANELECSREEHRIFHAKRGCCNTTIISLMPEIKSCYLMAEGITGRDEVKCLAGKKVMAAMEMGEEATEEGKATLRILQKKKMADSGKESEESLSKVLCRWGARSNMTTSSD